MHVTIVIKFPLSDDVKAAICFLPFKLITLLYLCWLDDLISLTQFRKCQKNFTTFSDVKLTRAGVMLCGVLIDKTGCLLKKDRSYFLPAVAFPWLNGRVKPFLIAN
jgi:hypothetical protein